MMEGPPSPRFSVFTDSDLNCDSSGRDFFPTKKDKENYFNSGYVFSLLDFIQKSYERI